MDTAVALVQAYLHVNGYFTVTEYPVLEALHGDQVRTDLDVLAFRFARAGHDVVHGAGHRPLGRTSLVIDLAVTGFVKVSDPRIRVSPSTRRWPK